MEHAEDYEIVRTEEGILVFVIKERSTEAENPCIIYDGGKQEENHAGGYDNRSGGSQRVGAAHSRPDDGRRRRAYLHKQYTQSYREIRNRCNNDGGGNNADERSGGHF